ncbi:MAG: hypothetical protein KDC27_12740 [Acidobacteria bacterium]|nr:hypothetical protein [Acidobacteriota bacterium]
MAGWEDLLGGLADALVGGGGGGRGAARPVREPHVERLPARDELAEAEAETRRMMQEAAREMARDFKDSVEPLRQRMERAEAKVIDIDSNVVSRLDQMESALRELNLQALDAERLENKLNALIVLVIALVVITLWLGLR